MARSLIDIFMIRIDMMPFVYIATGLQGMGTGLQMTKLHGDRWQMAPRRVNKDVNIIKERTTRVMRETKGQPP